MWAQKQLNHPSQPEMKTAPDERGWQVGKALVDRLSHMFCQQVDCDVTFSFPNHQMISAHSFILKMGSPVFEAMFSGNFAETSNVDIADIELDVFKEMLRYLYTDTASITAGNAIPLLYAAKKYIIVGLSDGCTSFLNKQLNKKNACTILNGSLDYGEDALAKKAREYIRQHLRSILKDVNFLELRDQALLDLVKDDTLAINESELWAACMKWAQKKVDHPKAADAVRSKLGDILFQIRFHQIKPEELAPIMGSGNTILTHEEKNLFLVYSLAKSPEEKFKLERLGFNMTTRKNKMEPYPGDYYFQQQQRNW